MIPRPHHFTVRLSTSQLNILSKLAKAEDCSQAAILRRALLRYKAADLALRKELPK